MIIVYSYELKILNSVHCRVMFLFSFFWHFYDNSKEVSFSFWHPMSKSSGPFWFLDRMWKSSNNVKVQVEQQCEINENENESESSFSLFHNLGAVQIEVGTRGGGVEVIKKLREGEIVGELAVLGISRKRTATVRACVDGSGGGAGPGAASGTSGRAPYVGWS